QRRLAFAPPGGPFTLHGDPATHVHPPSPPSQGGDCFASERVALLAAKTPHGPDRAGSTIGLVGPMSNYAAPPQLVDDVPYHDLEEMHRFAQRWRDEHRGKWFTLPRLSGFCLLMKQAVHDAIGGLDERFGLGLFDDDDLAERARRAGFELAVAHDLFIHHFGSRPFAGNGIDAEKLLDENARRFAAKWGLPETRGRQVVLRPWDGSSDPHAKTTRAFDGSSEDVARNGPELATIQRGSETRWTGARDRAGVGQAFQPDVRLESLSHGKQCKVSLTTIVRDEQKNLSHALESVAGLFDEIVVVDTGSTDRTIEIARSFGARVFDFVWVDDFGAARNAALARATGDYAFWLDADDVVDPPEREKLRALLDQLRAGDEACYVVRCKCDPSPDGSGGETVVDHIRLFPLREDVRWTYRVHEQILPALKRAGVPVRWTGITVRHTGYVDKPLRARKLDRDTKILREDVEDQPDDPFILFNLGSISVERQDWLAALGFLRRSLAGSAPTDSITRKLFALIALAHQKLGDSQAALRTCAKGLRLAPDDAELLFREAVVHRNRGESGEAERCWRRILTLPRPDQFSSVDQGIYGHLTRRNLAALAAERGDHAEAGKLWTEVLAECPGDREALAKLKDLSLVLGP
ncbi:MAG: glycosyltransferase, partial [Isosphaerales bacterium]